MEVGKRKVGGSVVAAGSVWESRMKSDEVRGGIKVFNAEEQQNPEENGNGAKLLKRSPIGCGKRKTWKSEKAEEQCKELSISSSSDAGVKKSPIHSRKIADKFERSPIHIRKMRSEAHNKSGESDERTSSLAQLRKSKSDSTKKDASIQLRKTKSATDRAPAEKIEAENGKNDAAAAADDDDVCQEKVIQGCSVRVDGDSDGVVDAVDDDDEEEGEIEIEMENENERIDVKEISIPESKVNDEVVVNVNEQDKKVVAVVVVNEPEEEEPKKILKEPEPNKKILNQQPEPEPKRVVSAHMRFHHRIERKPLSVPIPLKQSPTLRRNNSTIHQNFSQANNSIPKATATQQRSSFPQTQSKLQSLADLIMWRDVSRSAFVFGFGSFLIVSSSYAKDINLSLISVMSYISLVYLAVIFLYRSLICRGIIHVEDSNYIVGEEDAIWMLKLILPYLNEFLSKLKALFSGDPGTTIKLAVLLFVLARCGSYITVWKMAKFGFFGVFTVPKICSSYSAQLTEYGNFWIRRFRDAWDSCTHKKAVALGIFGLVWNLSSVLARIWAVFVLFAAFRYYQQHYLVRDEDDETWQDPVATNFSSNTNKVKKGF